MYFFFYGTLLAGSVNRIAAEIHRKLEPRGPAWVTGTLYAVPDPCGWYPALLGGAGSVHGHLYEADSGFTEQDLAVLDAYEDYDPASPSNSLYMRGSMQAVSADRANWQVQAYRYQSGLPMGSQLIVEGDFRAWLEQRGAQEFDGL
jgi:gamma-glutamylcyclotransferase (GGCT)/AIG2-like uncharacterized protein YtfP